ncbi:reverse transcriptase [Gossypium australe]|uniref:Reverse transcriptase n=1 Tax=Gossypium australe TaxID=47621 RepID=A0A5B6WEJ1_9ROSI|nr:reverse transcriptase [Gossypium australe]
MLKLHRPQLVFFMETKLDCIRVEHVRKHCGFQNGLDVSANNSSGGLSLAWNGNYLIMYAHEKTEGAIREERPMEDFWKALADCDLIDMGFLGLRFTWERGDVLGKLEHRAELIDVKLDLNWEMENEEMYREQRARANWMRQGERNKTFFHSQASQRHRLNKIRGLENDRGVFKMEYEELEAIARDYFLGLFSSKGVGDTDHLLSEVKCCTNDSRNHMLTARYKEEEIIDALSSIGPTKASGPDGFPAIFFQKIWHIIGRKVLDLCIDLAQSAFVLRILITDNMLLTYEILHTFEVLSTLMRLASEEGLREAADKSTETFENVLKEYEVCLGQCVNYGK